MNDSEIFVNTAFFIGFLLVLVSLVYLHIGIKILQKGESGMNFFDLYFHDQEIRLEKAEYFFKQIVIFLGLSNLLFLYCYLNL